MGSYPQSKETGVNLLLCEKASSANPAHRASYAAPCQDLLCYWEHKDRSLRELGQGHAGRFVAMQYEGKNGQLYRALDGIELSEH